jgi:hypothetical protein
MTKPVHSDPPRFICVDTGGAFQVYRHEPEGDTDTQLSYINHEPLKIWKTEVACKCYVDTL